MHRTLILASILSLLTGSACGKLKDSDVKKIKQAVPEEAPAKPSEPRKVLLYSHCNGFRHGKAIEAAKIAFPLMGEKTGAFEVVVSDDLSNFEPEKIKTFDAIILSNTTGELLMPKGKRKKKDAENQAEMVERGKKLRESFMNWVKSGGAVVGVHAATDCSYKWKEYGEMIGGYFSGHPWNMKVHVSNDDPDHPINAVFDGKDFQIKDEIYQFNKGVYDRSKQRVLLSLDVSEGKTPNRGKRKDNDYGLSWIKTHGKGRVFYCAFGHHQGIFQDPQILKHLLAGLQWAMGDLEAPAEPQRKK